MDKELEKELLEKVGKEATEATKKAIKDAEKSMTEKYEDVTKGLMTEKAFQEFQAEKMDPINEALKVLKEASVEQGNKINTVLEKSEPNSITFEDFLVKEFEKVKGTGKMVEFNQEQLKEAGVRGIFSEKAQTVTSTIPIASPYAPGLTNGALSIFDIARNPNFISSRVNLGRTDRFLLAWANESAVTGVPTLVAEGGLKPEVNRTFTVETSQAKKVAAWAEYTEEYAQDLPGFATFTRRKLEEDVYRAFDDAIQTAIQLAARPYQITQLDDQVTGANYWDAMLAMMAQVGYYNYNPNTAAINWLTNVMLKTAKNTMEDYLTPTFYEEIARILVYANKMAFKYALVGDLRQYNVDIYKDIYVKMGLINDQLIRNKESIVVEMRYHNYISDARKNALVYDRLNRVASQIDGTPTLS